VDKRVHNNIQQNRIAITTGSVQIEGLLNIPQGAEGIVIFALGSGSGIDSPRHQFITRILHNVKLATLLLDLLTPHEQLLDRQTYRLRLDIDRLTARLMGATNWILSNPTTQNLKLGYLGDSTGSTAALVAGSFRPNVVRAIACCSGRLDLAGATLSQVRAPTLLIVGSKDISIIAINQKAAKNLRAKHQLVIIPGATHLLKQSSPLEEVARLVSRWFSHYLIPTHESDSSLLSVEEQPVIEH
jgi:pimeloyl-ACP methyl ester carboxylesterase